MRDAFRSLALMVLPVVAAIHVCRCGRSCREDDRRVERATPRGDSPCAGVDADAGIVDGHQPRARIAEVVYAGRARRVRLRRQEVEREVAEVHLRAARQRRGESQVRQDERRGLRRSRRHAAAVGAGLWRRSHVSGPRRMPRVSAGLRGPPQSDAKPVSFEDATIERKLPGTRDRRRQKIRDGHGRSWPSSTQALGGAPRSQVDALRLLATLLQHTDSKPAQQRILCVSYEKKSDEDLAACKEPLLMLNDVGLTFGHANAFNRNGPGQHQFRGVVQNAGLERQTGCVGDISKSMTGTLEHPASAKQDAPFLPACSINSPMSSCTICSTSRGSLSARGIRPTSGSRVFKRKRDEVANRTCPQ